MIYFIYGQDSYRAKEKLQEIADQYKSVHKSGLNLVQIDAKENNFNDLLDNFKIISMFNEKKLIILKDIFLNQKFGEDFLREIKILKDSKNIVIVFEKNEVDQRTKLFKALIKNAKCQEFNFLAGMDLKNWFKKESEKYKLKIDPVAEATLLSYAQNDLWQLVNEIKKLANFKPDKLIKKEDIILQVKPKTENDIFKTIDAISQKDKKQALSFLHKHLDDGDNPLYLLSMITYQFRNLLIIKEMIDSGLPYAVIQRKSGLAPFVASKTYYLCSKFAFLELKKIYQKIFQADLSIKTGKVDAETALDLLVAGL
ncbi:MAG: DNA polymerase III subunit delta [Candidatus Staskawiczbacteria bacterium]|nr:DNA polymerase III subunit delta [Candidatus Staskawiczbacteria bacterium]MBI3337011.1 DNA polymerase III subunit delta [Candidatus Staskawiczbacteria bacterium]